MPRFALDINADNRIVGSVNYNKAVNNNYQTFSPRSSATLATTPTTPHLHARPSDAGWRHGVRRNRPASHSSSTNLR